MNPTPDEMSKWDREEAERAPLVALYERRFDKGLNIWTGDPDPKARAARAELDSTVVATAQSPTKRRKLKALRRARERKRRRQ